MKSVSSKALENGLYLLVPVTLGMIQQITKKYKYLIEILEPTGYTAKENVLLLKVDLLERLLKHFTVCLNSGNGENLDYFV